MKIDRRSFLKSAAGLAASLAVPSLGLSAIAPAHRLTRVPTTMPELLACTADLTASSSAHATAWMVGFTREALWKSSYMKLFASTEWKAFCNKHGDYILQNMWLPPEDVLKSMLTDHYPSGDAFRKESLRRMLKKVPKADVIACPSWMAFVRRFPEAASECMA